MPQAFLVSAGMILLFGIVVPLLKGLDFLNPFLLTAYLLLGIVIVAPAAASAFSGREPIDGRQALRKLGLVAGFAWGLAIAVTAAGLITVNLESRHSRLPDVAFLAAGILCSAAATVFTALLSALVARKYSADTARNGVRLIFLGLLIFGFALARFSGADWLSVVFRWSTTRHMRELCTIAAVVLAAADVALTLPLARTLSRPAAGEALQ